MLFVCSQNRLRSPTAELVFATHPGIECGSAGLNRQADNPLTPELIEWADLVFVMEPFHRDALSARFGRHLGTRPVVCLEIPDVYGYLDPELVRLLKERVTPYLAR